MDGFDIGRTIYVSGRLVGENEEGVQCSPIFIPLASALQLPQTPEPVNILQDKIGDAEGDGMLKKNSMGSKLSVNDRVINMHHGLAAYHDPLVSKLHRNHISMEALISTGKANRTFKRYSNPYISEMQRNTSIPKIK